MEFLEVFKFIVMLCGGFATIITLLVAIFKPLRQCFVDKILAKYKAQEKEEEQNERFDELKEMIVSLSKTIENQMKINENQKLTNEQLSDALRGLLRNSLVHLYYKYIPDDAILPEIERANIVDLYQAYSVSLNGNSYIEHCYNELMEKPFKKI